MDWEPDKGLQKLANEMEDAVKGLKKHLDRCEKHYCGPAGKRYDLVLEDPGSGKKMSYWYMNGATKDTQLNPPKVGGRLPPGDRSGYKNYIIKSYEESPQPETKTALSDLGTTKESTRTLSRLVESDLDDLVELVRALASSHGTLDGISKQLNKGHAGIMDLEESAFKARDWWKSDARQEYQSAAGGQKNAFQSAENDAGDIMKADRGVAREVTSLVRALRNVAQGRQDSAVGTINDIVSSPAKSWPGMALQLMNKISDWDKKHNKEVDEKLRQLEKTPDSIKIVKWAEDHVTKKWQPALVDAPGPGRPDKPDPVAQSRSRREAPSS